MKVTYDNEADAVYIKFSDMNSDITDTQGEWPINVDLASGNEVVGIEILEASTIFSQDYLNKAERIG